MKYKFRFDPIAANEYEAAYSYQVDEKKKMVIIISVYHNKRDPEKKHVKTP